MTQFHFLKFITLILIVGGLNSPLAATAAQAAAQRVKRPPTPMDPDAAIDAKLYSSADSKYDRGTDIYIPPANLNSRPAPISSAPLSCKLRVLQSLGWNVQQTPQGSAPHAVTGNICHLPNISEIAKSGGLRVDLPAGMTTRKELDVAEDLVDDALRSTASLCAYGTVYGEALRRASYKLLHNHFYSFNSFLHKGSVRLAGINTWREVSCVEDERCFIPNGNIAAAVNSLYTASYASECAAGMHLAEYSTILELFGANGINSRFRPKEFFTSDWPNIEKSQSVIHGVNGRRFFDTDGLNYARAGADLLLGVPGYLGNVYGDKYLDTTADRGENFLITSITPAAATALAKHGGLEFYNGLAKQLWELIAGMGQQESLALEFQGRGFSPNANEAAKILRDPFLAQTQTYVHGVGFKSLAGHLVRLARLNPRTPYSFFFYAEAAHGEIYDRWLKMQLDSCSH